MKNLIMLAMAPLLLAACTAEDAAPTNSPPVVDAGAMGPIAQEPEMDVEPLVNPQPVEGGAPNFTLPDATGKEHSLFDYRGKIVVLEWINHGCPFVKKHYKSSNMQSMQEKYTAQDVVWLSICSSAPGKQGHMSADKWIVAHEKHASAETAVLLDPAGDVGRLYDARTTPHMFVIDTGGRVAYEGAIDSIKSADPADIPRATNYVTEVLDAMLAGEPAPHTETKPYGCSVKYDKKASD